MYVAHRRIFVDVSCTFLEFSAAILELHGNVWVDVICGLRSGLPDRIMRSDWSEETEVRKFAAGTDQRKGGK